MVEKYNQEVNRTGEVCKHHVRNMTLAYEAANLSMDPSRKVGAVIVSVDEKILSTSTNGLPVGVFNEMGRLSDRTNGEKYFWIEHAERNAIYGAAKRGVALNGSKIYVTLFPCADCARAIIQSGIIELIVPETTSPIERFERSTVVALQMMREAGLKITELPTHPSSTPK